MPYFRFPHFPFPNNIRYYNSKYYNSMVNKSISSDTNKTLAVPLTTVEHKKNSSHNNENYFFELLGLKLYFDDVLLICLIFFLYQEGVKDEELFISLILLLLS